MHCLIQHGALKFLQQIYKDGKNATKGALNLRGEAIAFFHLPSESLSSQEAESLDQESKEVSSGKMVRIVEAIDQ